MIKTIPTVATFPRGDEAFAAFVRDAITRLERVDRLDPAALQNLLRRWHSRAIVRERDALASFGASTWYVYRDGQAGVRIEDDWWQRDGVAVARLGEDQVFIDGDDEACRLVGRPPGGLAGASWRELVPPVARDDDAEWLFGDLKERPVQSVFDFPLADGGRRVIEYRTAWVPEEAVYLCRWRELTVIDSESLRELVREAEENDLP
jgi:PAS domain-containing protein